MYVVALHYLSRTEWASLPSTEVVVAHRQRLHGHQHTAHLVKTAQQWAGMFH